MANITPEYKAKIFKGHAEMSANNKEWSCHFKTADDAFNEWIKEHRNIVILNFKYDQDSFGGSSICILYTEV